MSEPLRGSSPLSRGILRPVDSGDVPQGIIPALAGNTPPWPAAGSPAWDHPRSRGEYALAREAAGKPGGSSPLSRGILAGGVTGGAGYRIIPALAGNTPGMRTRT